MQIFNLRRNILFGVQVPKLPPPPPTTEVIHSLENLLKSVNKNSVMIGDFNLPDVDWMEGGQQQCETQVAH
jgi:hypothetical protein